MFFLLPILHVLGFVIALFALTMLAPLGLALASSDGGLVAFDEAFLITGTAGVALWAGTRRFQREMQVRDGFLLVTLVWTVLPLLATLPLIIYFHDTPTPISFTDAFFEAMSGLTTTGATVLTKLDRLPPSINLWRCQLQWMGGMGILILAVAILPLLGMGGSQLVKAEAAGPMKDTKLTPRITETAKGLWTVYCVLSLACLLAYRWGGMSWFDAWTHMFTTMSLGGLSTHDASFGYFQSARLDWICVIFMLIASCNFALYFMVWRRRSLKIVWKDAETQGTLLVMIGSVLALAVFLQWKGSYPDFWTSLRHTAFNVISIASTTGYATVDFAAWPILAPVWMLFLSCFASSAGSTGAGIKMIRAIILLKQAKRELAHILHPALVNPVTVEHRQISNKVIFSILAFMLMYGTSIIGLTLVLAATDLDIISAFSAVVASINNTGPGLNAVGPATTFASLTDFQTWVLAFAMLLGRLEMFTVFVVFTPAFWRK